MNEKDDIKMEIANQKEEEDLGQEEIKEINCKEDLIPFFAQSDHSVNKVYFSKIPEVCKDEPCQLGVDEAGRGPALGPMVYGITYAPLSQKQLLVDLGCADSKSLKEETRDKIFDDVCEHRNSMGWAVEVISPNTIANNMYRRTKVSLNEISMVSATDLIRGAIEAGVNVTEVYVDTVGRPESYQARLAREFPGVKIVVEKKADATYPVVSAASICAKVARDHVLRAWLFRETVDYTNEYGSGYPNDPATKAWLDSSADEVFGYPQIVRFSWSTIQQMLEPRALPVEWEETETHSRNEQSIQKFFRFQQPGDSREAHAKKHPFFLQCNLSNVTLL